MWCRLDLLVTCLSCHHGSIPESVDVISRKWTASPRNSGYGPKNLDFQLLLLSPQEVQNPDRTRCVKLCYCLSTEMKPHFIKSQLQHITNAHAHLQRSIAAFTNTSATRDSFFPLFHTVYTSLRTPSLSNVQ